MPHHGCVYVSCRAALCSGLHPTPLRLKQQVDPLWTISQHAECAPTAQKLPPAAVLAGIPTFKEWPETAQVCCCCAHIFVQLYTSKCSSFLPASHFKQPHRCCALSDCLRHHLPPHTGAHRMLGSPHLRAAQQPDSGPAPAGFWQAVTSSPRPADLPGHKPACGAPACGAQPWEHRGLELRWPLQSGGAAGCNRQVSAAAALA